MRGRRRCWVHLGWVLVLLVACGDDSSGTGPPPPDPQGVEQAIKALSQEPFLEVTTDLAEALAESLEHADNELEALALPLCPRVSTDLKNRSVTLSYGGCTTRTGVWATGSILVKSVSDSKLPRGDRYFLLQFNSHRRGFGQDRALLDSGQLRADRIESKKFKLVDAALHPVLRLGSSSYELTNVTLTVELAQAKNVIIVWGSFDLYQGGTPQRHVEISAEKALHLPLQKNGKCKCPSEGALLISWEKTGASYQKCVELTYSAETCAPQTDQVNVGMTYWGSGCKSGEGKSFNTKDRPIASMGRQDGGAAVASALLDDMMPFRALCLPDGARRYRCRLPEQNGGACKAIAGTYQTLSGELTFYPLKDGEKDKKLLENVGAGAARQDTDKQKSYLVGAEGQLPFSACSAVTAALASRLQSTQVLLDVAENCAATLQFWTKNAVARHAICGQLAPKDGSYDFLNEELGIGCDANREGKCDPVVPNGTGLKHIFGDASDSTLTVGLRPSGTNLALAVKQQLTSDRLSCWDSVKQGNKWQRCVQDFALGESDFKESDGRTWSVKRLWDKLRGSLTRAECQELVPYSEVGVPNTSVTIAADIKKAFLAQFGLEAYVQPDGSLSSEGQGKLDKMKWDFAYGSQEYKADTPEMAEARKLLGRLKHLYSVLVSLPEERMMSDLLRYLPLPDLTVGRERLISAVLQRVSSDAHPCLEGKCPSVTDWFSDHRGRVMTELVTPVLNKTTDPQSKQSLRRFLVVFGRVAVHVPTLSRLQAICDAQVTSLTTRIDEWWPGSGTQTKCYSEAGLKASLGGSDAEAFLAAVKADMSGFCQSLDGIIDNPEVLARCVAPLEGSESIPEACKACYQQTEDCSPRQLRAVTAIKIATSVAQKLKEEIDPSASLLKTIKDLKEKYYLDFVRVFVFKEGADPTSFDPDQLKLTIKKGQSGKPIALPRRGFKDQAVEAGEAMIKSLIDQALTKREFLNKVKEAATPKYQGLVTPEQDPLALYTLYQLTDTEPTAEQKDTSKRFYWSSGATWYVNLETGDNQHGFVPFYEDAVRVKLVDELNLQTPPSFHFDNVYFPTLRWCGAMQGFGDYLTTALGRMPTKDADGQTPCTLYVDPKNPTLGVPKFWEADLSTVNACVDDPSACKVGGHVPRVNLYMSSISPHARHSHLFYSFALNPITRLLIYGKYWAGTIPDLGLFTLPTGKWIYDIAPTGRNFMDTPFLFDYIVTLLMARHDATLYAGPELYGQQMGEEQKSDQVVAMAVDLEYRPTVALNGDVFVALTGGELAGKFGNWIHFWRRDIAWATAPVSCP